MPNLLRMLISLLKREKFTINYILTISYALILEGTVMTTHGTVVMHHSILEFSRRGRGKNLYKATREVMGKGTALNLKDVKLLKNSYLRKNGVDAHTLKDKFVGKRNRSLFDIYRHTETGELLLFQKQGKRIPIQTGDFIK